jgi:hypothetical protein
MLSWTTVIPDLSEEDGVHLAAAIQNVPLVAQAVTVFDVAGDQVGHRLNAAVGVPREAFGVVGRIPRIERIQHQEGVELPGGAGTQHAHQLDAGAVHWVGAGYCPADVSRCSHTQNLISQLVLKCIQTINEASS